jgi:hypothetical protein
MANSRASFPSATKTFPSRWESFIDNSGSMREKRNKVNQAALNLVRSSNPRDEVFIVNFNDAITKHVLGEPVT